MTTAGLLGWGVRSHRKGIPMSAIRTEIVSTRLRESQVRELREAATEADCTVSEFVARLVRLALIQRSREHQGA